MEIREIFTFKYRVSSIIFFLLFFFIGEVPSFSANYDLEIIRPKEGIGNYDRIYRAYPYEESDGNSTTEEAQIEYNIRAAVRGGLYPFVYALIDDPNDPGDNICHEIVTINSNTGVIVWEKPSFQYSPLKCTLSVTDAESTAGQSKWTITVTAANTYFVDSTNGHYITDQNPGDGSFKNPWKGWSDFYFGRLDSSYNGAVIYFREGDYTYPPALTYGRGGDSNRINLNSHPRAYLKYPADTGEVIFDGEKDTNKIHLFPGKDNYYFDGITFANGYGFGIEMWTGNYFVVRRSTFRDFYTKASASNQAGVSFRNDARYSDGRDPIQGYEPPENNSFKFYPVIQDCLFTNFNGPTTYINNNPERPFTWVPGGINNYGVKYALYEDNIFEKFQIAASGVRLKSTVHYVTIRHNTFNNTSLTILAQYYAFDADISFNYMTGANNIIEVGSYGNSSGPVNIYIYRNTLDTRSFFFRSIGSDDGPVYIYNNVIVNNDPADHIRNEAHEHWSIDVNKAATYPGTSPPASDADLSAANLIGSPTDDPENMIIDSNGSLVNRDLVGTYGWETGNIPLKITTTTLPQARVGMLYSQTLQAQGGQGQYTWSLIDGNLPPEMTLETGIIAGTPTTALNYEFELKVTDGSQDNAAKVLSINVIMPDTTPPGAPQNLEAVEVSETEIRLEWDAAVDNESGISGYEIFKEGEKYTVTGLTYTGTSLTEGTEYTYAVGSVNGEGLVSVNNPVIVVSTLADEIAPQVTKVECLNNNEVRVTFSEEVETAGAQTASNYVINNGITVITALLLSDNQTVILSTSRLIEGINYTLQVQVDTVSDITDRATIPNVIIPSTHNFNVPQRVTDGLVALYGFNKGSGTVIYDISGVAPVMDLSITSGTVNWLSNRSGVEIIESSIIKNAAPNKLYEKFANTNNLTVEVWIEPANLTQEGPSRIVSYSQDTSYRNFTLGQSAEEYNMRLRLQGTTDRNGSPSLSTTGRKVKQEIQHLVVTYDSVVKKMYVDGIATGDVQNIAGNFSTWQNAYQFVIGNEVTGDRTWLGKVYLAAIYNKALTASDVEKNYNAGSDLENPISTLPEAPKGFRIRIRR